MKRFFKNIVLFFKTLFVGMKSTEEAVLHKNDEVLPGNAVIKEVESNRVSKALLKGEITQQVEELRYRTYLIDREAKEYNYIAPTLARRAQEKDDSKFVEYENSDNLEIVTIQPNDLLIENLIDRFDSIDTEDETVENINLGKFDKNKKYYVKVHRKYISRFKIEEYTKRLVVRKFDDNHDILDFYVSKYPNPEDIKSKGFVREVEKIRDQRIKSDILDINRVNFVTNHAYKKVDMLEYEFDNLGFQGVFEFDGHYILRFKSRVVKDGCDLTDRYYSKTMDEKYKNNEKKEVVIDMTGAPIPEVFVCEECGKQIIYDPVSIDEADVTRPREIDEEQVFENEDELTEYFDLQLSQQTFNKTLCRKCLNKFLKNKQNKMIEEVWQNRNMHS